MYDIWKISGCTFTSMHGDVLDLAEAAVCKKEA